MKAWKSILIGMFLLMFNAVAGATPLGTEFRYTGFLTDNGSPASGYYDFQATLYDADQGGNAVGVTQKPTKVPVTNGVFQLLLDFGAKFDGTKLWLELSVVPNGNNNWTLLSPRQSLTATPYSLFAPTAGSANTANNVANNSVTGLSIQNSSITASKIANGEVVKSLNNLHDDVNLLAGNGVSIAKNVQNNTLEISALSVAGNWWSVTGNSGTTPAQNFLGTLDNQPLEMHVNNARALRLEPANVLSPLRDEFSVNVIGGHRLNGTASGVIGATIAGGGFEAAGSQPGAFPNSVVDDFGSVGGGYSNRADYAAVVAGGYNNFADYRAVVAGGHDNSASQSGFTGGGDKNWMDPAYSRNSVIGGGTHNQVYRTGEFDDSRVFYNATIGGGSHNIVGGDAATVPGGSFNRAYGYASFAAGEGADAFDDRCFVWNGAVTGFASTGPSEFDVRAPGGARLSSDTELYFGAQTRQMIHLWGDTDGIGVQDATVYFRTGGSDGTGGQLSDGFAWYAGGSHVDTVNDPGGGYELMELRYDPEGERNPETGKYHPGAMLAVWGGIYCDAVCRALWFETISDRSRKTAFEAVNNQEILDRVLALPITKWSFTNAPAIRNLGPMAQDFYAAFGLGTDDKHIGLADEGGVALAAIQGLNQKLEEQAKAKDAEIQTLKKSLGELRQMVDQLAAQMKGVAR